MWVLLALACKPDPVGPEPGPVVPETTTEWGTTPPVDGCPGLTSVAVETSPGNPLERRFVAELDGAAPIFATCTADSAPAERHLAESTGAAAHQELVVRGLLGWTEYRCTIRPTCGGPAVEATFTPVLPGIPPFEVETSGAGPSAPYTLLNTQYRAFTTTGAWLVIVDPDGQPRWTYFVGTDLVGDIDAEIEDGGTTVHMGGGWAYFDVEQPNRGVFRDVDLSGNVLLDHPEPVFGLGFNHHSDKLEDGSYLSSTGSVNHLGDREWYGVGIEHWHPSLGLLWGWSSQQLVDEGVLGEPDENETAPYHANSVSFVSDTAGEGAWVSLYKAREIWRIDRATGERTHVFGPNGDFALIDVNGNPLPPEDWTYVQHDPDWLPDGRVVMYDNGQGRPSDEPYSRVVEYRVDLEAASVTLLWDWTEPGWYDPVLGDADYLPNGNVLVTKGFNTGWTPNRDDVSQVLELRPPDEVVWRLSWTEREWTTFRAQRYEGCDVFANARYCPSVAERIAELEAGLPQP